MFHNRPEDPTPEQIRQRCAEIQQRWTPGERERRRVCYASTRNAAASDYQRQPWQPPTIRVADLGVAS